MLSTSRSPHLEMIDDSKEKPEIVKLYDFSKGGPDTVDQLDDYYTTQPKSGQLVNMALFYMLENKRQFGA